MASTNRWVAVLAAVAFALVAPACGGSDDGDADQAADRTKAPAGDSGQAQAANGDGQAQDTSAEPGTGTEGSGYVPPPKSAPTQGPDISDKAPKYPPYTRYGFDRGSKQHRNEVMGLYREMQRDFYAGDGLAFCRRFGTGLRTLPDLEAGDGQERVKECARVVAQTTQRIDNGSLRWPPHTIAWVRIYNDPGQPTFGGITVDSAGRQGTVRLSFVKIGGTWVPDFKFPSELHAISAR